MSRVKGPDYRGLRARLAADELRRQEALRNGGAGLVVQCCRTCQRPIATTPVDRAKGEPSVLLVLPEDRSDRWQCTECAPPFMGKEP